MKKIITTIAVSMALCLTGCLAGSVGKTNTTNKYAGKDVSIFGEFAAKTSAEIMKESAGENVCFSPAGYYMILSLMAECGDEKMRQDISESTGFKTFDEARSYNKELYKKINVGKIHGLTSSDEIPTEINVSNSIWLNEIDDKNINQETVDNCVNNYGVELFNKKIEEADINNWASEKTNGLIDKVIDEKTASALEAALINVLYFKNCWTDEFKNIKTDKFYKEKGGETEAEFMQEKFVNRYLQGDKFTAVSKSFYDGSKMFFVLPSKGTELSKIASEDVINQIIASSEQNLGTRAEITLKIPKFTCKSEIELNELSDKIGLKSALSGSKYTALSENIKGISVLSQNTKIVVDEKGVEAAAVTKDFILKGNKEEKNIEQKEIICNRPFMYIIVKDNIPLFIGTVYNPAE